MSDMTMARSQVEILLVEDSATQAEALRFILERRGYRTVVATDGRRALDLLAGYRPTIVISDIIMPEMDGYQLCEAIKTDANLQDVPVILLTALSEPKDVLRGLACGADNFLIKPYDEQLLLSRINYLLANQEFRKSNRMNVGLEVEFSGERFYVNSERQQILDLLLSTYEAAAHQNHELAVARDELQALNATLEQRVAARTDELARAEATLRQFNRALRAISLCNQALMRATGEPELLGQICEAIVDTIGCCLVWVAYPDWENRRLCPAAWAGLATGYLENLQFGLDTHDTAIEPSVRAVRIGQSVVVADLTQETPGIWREAALRQGCRSMIALPLCTSNGNIGVLTIAMATIETFSVEDRELLQELADDLAYGIDAQRDRVKRKHAEAELGRSEQRYRFLYESMAQGVVYFDAGGCVISANAAAQRVLGLTWEEMRGLRPCSPKWRRFRPDGSEFSPEDYPAVQALTSGKTIGDVVMCLVNARDGEPRWINLSAVPQFHAGESVPYQVFTSFDDITAQKRFEQTLQEKNVELENANLAKDRFLASMSHELRTPLNAILGFTGTLLMKLPGPLTDDQEKQLSTVQSSAKHLLCLINDLLDLVKIESGKVEINLEPTSCRSVIEEVAKALRPLAEARGLRFEVLLPTEDIVVKTSHRALLQIIINLTNNAIKYTEAGAVVIECVQRQGNGMALTDISVRDTGIGIHDHDRVKLFQPFSQLDSSSTRRYEGAGLGLYLSKKLADLIGGRISFTSEVGKGSTFTVTLKEK